MVSPLFDTKNRPKAAINLAEIDLSKLEKARQGKEFVTITHETCPGIFLLALERVQQVDTKFDPFPVPKSWGHQVFKVHLLVPDPGPINIRNGSQTITIISETVSQVIGTIQHTFKLQGFEVVLGAPTRFERVDVI